MFNESEIQSLGEQSTTPTSRFNWSSLPVAVLIQHMNEIRQHLPPLSIKDMDMEQEMLLQFHSVRALQDQIIDDDELPLNQRAAIINATTSSLTKLADLQEQIYTSERFKRVENVLVRALSKLPEDVASQFLDDYEAVLLGKA